VWWLRRWWESSWLVGARLPGANTSKGVAAHRDKQETKITSSWDPKAAAAYLERRQSWWMEWPKARRDHETFSVSCHTAVPYALSRSALRPALAQRAPSRTSDGCSTASRSARTADRISRSSRAEPNPFSTRWCFRAVMRKPASSAMRRIRRLRTCGIAPGNYRATSEIQPSFRPPALVLSVHGDARRVSTCGLSPYHALAPHHGEARERAVAPDDRLPPHDRRAADDSLAPNN